MLEGVSPLGMGLLEPVQHPQPVLSAQAVANGLLSLLDALLEPAAIPSQLLPGPPAILLAAYVILCHLLVECHLFPLGTRGFLPALPQFSAPAVVFFQLHPTHAEMLRGGRTRPLCPLESWRPFFLRCLKGRREI